MMRKRNWSTTPSLAFALALCSMVAVHGADEEGARLLAQADPAIEILDEEMPGGTTASAPAPAPAPMVGDIDAETVPALPPATPAPAPAAVPAAVAVDPLVEEVAGQEMLRRRAEEEHGLQSLADAEKAMKEKDYLFAIRMYEEAEKYIGSRPETLEQRKRIAVGYPEALYHWAGVLQKRKDLDKAKQFAHQAVGLGHKKALKRVEEIQELIDKPPDPPSPPPPRWRDKEFTAIMTDVEKLLNEGRQFYVTGEYESAKKRFEWVLKRDPENTEAIRWLEKTAQKRYDRATMELEATRRSMMTELRRTWIPRSYGLDEKPSDLSGQDDGQRREYEFEKERAKMIEKMKSIKIPEIDFRQANIYDVVTFLSEASIANDRTEVEEGEKKGVDIILDLGTGRQAAPQEAAVSDDPFADTLDLGDGGAAAGGGDIPLITFHARYVTLLEALRIVTSVAGLKYTIRGSVVMVVPIDAPEGDIVVRMYDVVPGVEERIGVISREVVAGGDRGAEGDFIAIGGGDLSTERGDWKTFFETMGVPFPDGSSIRYVSSIAKIIVANTPNNLATFEGVLAALNVVPSQIEIEARFVEVLQTDVDSLGFEWLLTDDWELLQRQDQAGVPIGNRERISISANSALGGFTRANRFAADVDIAASEADPSFGDDILRIGGVLTNPELNLVLHALNQMGNTDLLSAPKVTTQSGAEATIKVVTEYIYPTEFTVEPIVGYSGSNVSGSSQPIGAVVEPGGFETREVGVILTVLPEVSAEGQMITLTLAPEVVSEPTWRNYGSTYQTFQVDQATADPTVVDNTLPMEQPFFHTRSVSTTINIYNTSTVIMGGMITEHRTDVDDKIPFLGDIPIAGRLFRSRYEKSEKRNLLIFVTARLVDPAGRQIGESEQEKKLNEIIAGAATGEEVEGTAVAP